MVSVVTDMKCPTCRTPLVLMEDKRYVWLGCDKCLRYLRYRKDRMIRGFLNYGDRLDWRGMINYLYERYMAALAQEE